MSKTNELFYAVHYDESPHLHVYNSRQEAQDEITAYATAGNGETVGPAIYSASELIFILEQTPLLRQLAVAAAEAIAVFPDSLTTIGLRAPVRNLANGAVAAFKAGRLDSSTTDEQKEKLADTVAKRDAILARESGGNPLASLLEDLVDASRFVNRSVRIVENVPRPDRDDITPLIGRDYPVEAYNPVTREVQILPPAGYGTEPLTLGEDEYVVVQTGTAAQTSR